MRLVTTALTLLLKPFAWAGILVPILPDNARQVMEAPVPFIVGTVKSPLSIEITPSAAVLHLDDFLELDEEVESGSGLGSGRGSDEGGLGAGTGTGMKDGGGFGESSASSRGLFAHNSGLTDLDSDVFLTYPTPAHPTNTDLPVTTRWYTYSKNDSVQTHVGDGNTLLGKCDPTSWQEKKYLRLPMEAEGRESTEFAPHPAEESLVDYLRHIRRVLHQTIPLSTSTSPASARAPAPARPATPLAPSGLLTPVTANTYLHRALSDLLTLPERRLVRTAVAAIHRINTRLCGDLVTHPAAWQRYGRKNGTNGEFDFYPEMFLAPRRAELAFQEGLVHTQLFCSFLDDKRSGYECRTKGDGVGEGRLIVDWLRFRVHVRRKRTRRIQGSGSQG